MKNKAEVVVIGAGIIGSTITYYLAKEGLDVVLVEKAGFCAGSSGATHCQIGMHNRFPGWELDLSFKSIEILKGLANKYDFEYDETGSLLLIDNPSKLEWIEKRRKKQFSAGIKSYYLTRKDLDREEPYLSQKIISAVFYPQSIRINSMRLCHALISDARKLGADINLHTHIRDIIVKNRKIQKVKTSNGDIETHHLINAAGAWSKKISNLVGLNIPLNINKGNVIITEQIPTLGIKYKGEVILKDKKGNPIWTSNQISELEKEYSVRFIFSQTIHGNCLIGRSGEYTKNLYDRRTSFLSIEAILSRAVKFMPCLKYVKCIRTFASFRPYSIDEKPILGSSQAVNGFTIATGHGDKGIGWMSSGKLLVDHLLGKKTFMSIEPFLFDRIENNI